MKDEVSASESSDEEPSSLDNLQSDSRTIKHQVSNGTGKGATDIENKILFMNSLNSTNNSNENSTSKDNKDIVGLQSEKICVPEISFEGELVVLLPLDGSSVRTEIGTNGTNGKDSDEIEKANETTGSNDLNSVEDSNHNFTFTDGEDQSDSLFLEVISTSEDSFEEKLIAILEENIIENNSSSPESPNKSEIKEDSQLRQEEFNSNEAIVPLNRPCNNEEINKTQIGIRANEDLLIKLRKANEDLALTLDDKPTDPSDLDVDVLTVADSVSNDGENCELNGNVELKAEILCEAVKQSSLDKEGKNEVPVTSNIATNPVQVDEVTVSVMNFIHHYEKKTTDSLDGDTLAEKPMESNSSKPKSLVQELVSDRNRLNDYYFEVFQTYKKENIAGDTSEILEVIQDANKLSSAEEKDEKCLINETKEDAIPIVNKIDLNSWSMKLAGSKLNKVELDSTDGSTDSSCDCKLESTPLKVSKTKNTQLDVSSDTPSFRNSIDNPESDDSSSSEYSNKCSKLENVLKNKIGYSNKNRLAYKYSSDTESTLSSLDTADSHQKLNRKMDELDSLRNKMTTTFENHNGTNNKGQVTSKRFSGTESSLSSSDTEGSASSEGEVTLLERAHREMVEINGKKQTLGEKANVLRRVLVGLESKIPSGGKSKESISDIQITTATYSSKAHGNKSASNGESEKHHLLHGSKMRESYSKYSSSLSSSSSRGNASDAKKSAKAGCSSSGKNVNSVQEKYRRFSLSSKTSSDDSESSVSYSGGSNCSVKRKRSKAAKNKTHSTAEKTHIQCPHKSFANADQGYFGANPPQNSSHANNSYFNHQSGFESSVHPTHEHDISCYMPSKHQCYSLNGQSSCQSQSCATWYDMFYSQWYFIHQHSSYFQ